MNIIRHKAIFLGVSGVLVGLSLIFIFIFGFKEAIDFKGGTLWQFVIKEQAPKIEELETFLKSELKDVGEIKINFDLDNQSFLVRLQSIDQASHQKFASLLKNKYPTFEELSFQSIGPSVGEKLRKNAITAVIVAIIAVSLYIAFSFRKVSKPVSSWKYGVITMVTLFHDIVIPAGLIALLGHYSNIEIDTNFIVALLVVMGFSVHDTIVVFDRVRENLFLDHGKTDFSSLINGSINQTMARSINTSLTLILVLIALIVVGPASLTYFILTLLVGVTTGVYSSIFVASPLLLVWHNLSRK